MVSRVDLKKVCGLFYVVEVGEKSGKGVRRVFYGRSHAVHGAV